MTKKPNSHPNMYKIGQIIKKNIYKLDSSFAQSKISDTLWIWT